MIMMWQALERLIKSQRFRFYIYIYMCVCVCVCVCARTRVCVWLGLSFTWYNSKQCYITQ